MKIVLTRVMSNIISVVLADDHEIVRNGIKQMLESENTIKVVGEASNGKEAVSLVMQLQPDVLITDISMPEMTGIEAASELVSRKTNSKILMLSMFDREEYVLSAVKLGAHGYLLKDTDKTKFIKAINKVVNGEKYFSSEISNIIVNQYLTSVTTGETLTGSGGVVINGTSSVDSFDITKREKQILSSVVNGQSNKVIAEELGISVRTIETHRLNIMKKLKVNNAADLVRIAMKNGLVD